MNTNTYYYDMLTKEEKEVYFDIKKGLSSFSPSFSVKKIDTKRLSEIFFMIRMDDPSIFYADRFSIRFYTDASSVEMIPKYLFKKNKLEEHKKNIDSRLDKLTRPLKGASDIEKEMFIHDFICKNVKYDKLKKSYSHEVIGPLINGIGVCEGISKTVKLMADRLGLTNIIALCDNNPDKGIKYRHTWNIIKINGRFYNLDVTFDDSLTSDQIRYDYFNLNDTYVYRDHEKPIYKVPACDHMEYNYYISNKLSFTKLEDLKKRLVSNAKKGKRLIFSYRGSYLTKTVLDQILSMIDEVAKSTEKYSCKVRLNYPQSVFDVSFETDHHGVDVDLQDANEGEKYDETELD